MFRTLLIGVICLGVGGAGCKDRPDLPELRSGVTKEAVIGTPPGTGARVRLARLPNGDLGVLSPDGKQVIIVQPEGYQVCEPTADALVCGPLTQMSAPCRGCFAEPCPCADPVCRPVCRQNIRQQPGAGSANPGTP